MNHPLDSTADLELEGSLNELSIDTAENQPREPLYLHSEEDGTLEHLELFEALLQDEVGQGLLQLQTVEDTGLQRLQQREGLSGALAKQHTATSISHPKKEKKINKERKGSKNMPKGQESGQKSRKNSLKLHPVFKLKRQQNEAIQQNNCSHSCLEKGEPDKITFSTFALAEDTEGSDPFVQPGAEHRQHRQSEESLQLEKDLWQYQCYLNLN